MNLRYCPTRDQHKRWSMKLSTGLVRGLAYSSPANFACMSQRSGSSPWHQQCTPTTWLPSSGTAMSERTLRAECEHGLYDQHKYHDDTAMIRNFADNGYILCDPNTCGISSCLSSCWHSDSHWFDCPGGEEIVEESIVWCAIHDKAATPMATSNPEQGSEVPIYGCARGRSYPGPIWDFCTIEGTPRHWKEQ